MKHQRYTTLLQLYTLGIVINQMSKSHSLEKYWTDRYTEGRTGWDIGYPSRPLKEYIDQLTDKDIKILIPGAGNAYEAEYLINEGFNNVYVLDISKTPLQSLKSRVPSFPDKQLIQEDFFTHYGLYDLIFEQTFFCSFEPTLESRSNYGETMARLLKPHGKLVGLWFDISLTPESKRPFGGTRQEYLDYLKPYFDIHTFEDCYNSIEPRQGTELFGIFSKR